MEHEGVVYKECKLKIIYDFDVYCGKSMHTFHGCGMANLEMNLEHKVVTDLTNGLDNKGHVIVVDSFFSNVSFFWNLEGRGIYINGTMRSNHIELLFYIKNGKKLKNKAQRDLDYMMHDSKKMCSIFWNDK